MAADEKIKLRSYRFDEDFIERLESAADERGLSYTQLVRDAVNSYLGERDNKKLGQIRDLLDEIREKL